VNGPNPAPAPQAAPPSAPADEVVRAVARIAQLSPRRLAGVAAVTARALASAEDDVRITNAVTARRSRMGAAAARDFVADTLGVNPSRVRRAIWGK